MGRRLSCGIHKRYSSGFTVQDLLNEIKRGRVKFYIISFIHSYLVYCYPVLAFR